MSAATSDRARSRHRNSDHDDRVLTVPANREYTTMLMQEELARERIRDMLTAVSGQRQARHARSARRWTRVAAWAQRRADSFSL
ncbi:hypothetical protein B1813_18160 [Saccharomonospora piscinae]|uniref:Uncharacterized protein n=1 Tax=Saccharomonospora piscinae TaxID=687388 RepID=A0A1V8ZY36_SACPI|nr:hypothetical protein [Saccharomonospora piscinae]OQO89792.1 hypothetical protein B1813_18160 [Saccharomonospora piscinae]